MCSQVEGVETFRLILKTRFVLEFKKFFYVPSFSRNFKTYCSWIWLFICKLNFKYFKNKIHIGGGTLVGGLFKIVLDPTFEYNYLNMLK